MLPSGSCYSHKSVRNSVQPLSSAATLVSAFYHAPE